VISYPYWFQFTEKIVPPVGTSHFTSKNPSAGTLGPPKASAVATPSDSLRFTNPLDVSPVSLLLNAAALQANSVPSGVEATTVTVLGPALSTTKGIVHKPVDEQVLVTDWFTTFQQLFEVKGFGTPAAALTVRALADDAAARIAFKVMTLRDICLSMMPSFLVFVVYIVEYSPL
jgi:hypothetical protein